MRDLLRAKVSTVREKIRERGILEEQVAKSLRKCERKLKATGNSHHQGALCSRQFRIGAPMTLRFYTSRIVPTTCPPWIASERFSARNDPAEVERGVVRDNYKACRF